jgi:hypothetical protein
LEQVPDGVFPSSSASYRWESQLTEISTRRDTESGRDQTISMLGTSSLPADIPWCDLVTGITSREHRNGMALDVVRAATSLVVDTRTKPGKKPVTASGDVVVSGRRRYDFRTDQGQAAVGYEISADGIGFRYTSLDPDRLVTSPAWRNVRQGLSPEFFRHALAAHPAVIGANLNEFQVAWLWELELSMLTATAIAGQSSLEVAAAVVDQHRAQLVQRTMAVIFQDEVITANPENDVSNPDPEGSEPEIGRLQKALQELEADPTVVAALRETRTALWSDDHVLLKPWLVDCYANSLGSAIFTALMRFMPELDPDTLHLDITLSTIWVTEATGGGVGHVVKIARALRTQSRAFAQLLDDAVRHCPRGAVAESLDLVALILGEESNAIAPAFAAVRASDTYSELTESQQALQRTLRQAGIPVTRELMVNLNAKFLKSLSAPDTDALISALVTRWRAEEERLGCAVDLRVFVVAAWRLEEFRQRVEAILKRIGGTDAGELEAQIFNMLQSLLWLSCTTSCPDCIETPSRFAQPPKPSRTLLLSQLPTGSEPIHLRDPEWRRRLLDRLEVQAAGSLAAPHANLDDLKRAVAGMLTTPIETEFQVLYPTVERISRDGLNWIVSLAVRELGTV